MGFVRDRSDILYSVPYLPKVCTQTTFSYRHSQVHVHRPQLNISLIIRYTRKLLLHLLLQVLVLLRDLLLALRRHLELHRSQLRLDVARAVTDL